MGSTTRLFLLLFYIAVGFSFVNSGYVITTPRKWATGSTTQVCISVTDKTGPGDELRVSVVSSSGNRGRFNFRFDPQPEEERKEVIIPEKIFAFTPGTQHTCNLISVPKTVSSIHGTLHITGTLAGTSINETREMSFATDMEETFVQTDKYRYKAGQKVQFRILTLTGIFFTVSTEIYPEVWVETPSGSRMSQWLNVTNPSGLVHLDVQLIDEAEEGAYKIKVRTLSSSRTITKTFLVEDYVLPRFEVTVTPPKYVLGTDTYAIFKVCAQYTFGQPVKGNLTLKVDNAGWGRHKITRELREKISGCQDMKVDLEDLDINSRNYHAYTINANAEVMEDGTDVVLTASTSVSISRTALTFQTIGPEAYRKPLLPFTETVLAKLPDGSPAANEPMEVCVRGQDRVCNNLTSDNNGIIKYTIPPQLDGSSVSMRALNYPRIPGINTWRNVMYESTYNNFHESYYSPSNSSIDILVSESNYACQPGQTIDLTLPVIFSAVNQTSADIYVQVVARGNIQYTHNQVLNFEPGEFAIDKINLIEPIRAPLTSQHITGTINIPIKLLPTASPNAKILVWYTRSDGEVVSDIKDIEISKCWSNKVELLWPQSRVNVGETLPLTLRADPNSVCSLGIVDKSVELLSASHDSLTLASVFGLAHKATVNQWEHSQIDNYEYCRNKTEPEPIEPIPIPLPRPVVVDAAPPAPPAPPPPEGSKRRKRSSPPFGRRHYRTDYVDALKMFDVAGVFAISDQTLETRPCTSYPVYPYFSTRLAGPPGLPEVAFAAVDYDDAVFFDVGIEDARPLAAVPGAGNEVTVTEVEEAPAPRTYFPETWLWELIPVESGEHQETLTFPDTITEWVGKAVCANAGRQTFGISPTASVVTFTPFFIDLTVAPSVKRGEIMPVKISVFNYLHEDLPVKIILEASSEYEILGATGRQALAAQHEAGVRGACITKQDKVVETVRIRPSVVGDVNVSVTAYVDDLYPGQCGPEVILSKRDAIIKPIKVEYEGFPREKTWTKYICSKDIHENTDSLGEWLLEAPGGVVEDSPRGWVTAVGDLLGPTLDNLGNLIRMPYGCGEQNMLNFSPNIYVLQYLDASGQGTPAVVAKTKRFMRSGYQRELQYRHKDGSFSAFGESDPSGSTWLTAFVVKSFAQARQFIEVDAADLDMSTAWLKMTQRENGCFESRGKVLHKGMKGGIAEGGSPALLSAYVLAALFEAGEDPASEVVANAVFCLSAATTNNPYELAQIAYALTLGKLPEADAVVAKLLAAATETSGNMFWELPDLSGRSAAVEVETAGYVLLALMEHNPELYAPQAHKIIKGISAKRNGQGGFISTQDTVVALQALAKYEASLSQEPVDLSISVTGNQLAHVFDVKEYNKLLMQRVDVPVIPSKVILDMSGQGCSLVQGVVRYNVFDPDASEAFSISVKTEIDYQDPCKSRNIEVCASYLLNDGQSNMAVVEVNLVSGYIPEKNDLKQIVGYGTGLVKRYEVDGSTINFYIDEFTHTDLCVKFRALEEVKVEDAKPGTVKVYDYYQPEFSVSQTYTFPSYFCFEPRPPRPPVIDDIVPLIEVAPTEEPPATTAAAAEEEPVPIEP